MTNGPKPLEPKWLFYVISAVPGLWIVGIILGIIYLTKPDPDCKAFGKNCLIAAIVSFVVVCLICVIVNVGCAGFSQFT
jgi:hypothetical protein